MQAWKEKDEGVRLPSQFAQLLSDAASLHEQLHLHDPNIQMISLFLKDSYTTL